MYEDGCSLLIMLQFIIRSKCFCGKFNSGVLFCGFNYENALCLFAFRRVILLSFAFITGYIIIVKVLPLRICNIFGL